MPNHQVSVYLIQTNDSWGLAPLVGDLNNCQTVFKFILVDRDYNEQRLKIVPFHMLSEALRLKQTDGRRKILQSYLTERDWSGQIATFLKRCPGVTFDEKQSLAIVIGAGVYVLEDEGVNFVGERESDAYTCIYDYRFTENPLTSEQLTARDFAIDSYAAVSVVRFEPVFGRRYQEETSKNRADRSRYLVTNIAHFLAARAFWHTLAREHSGQSCVMETNWGGGDYLAGYYTDGLCEACVELLHSKVLPVTVSYRLRGIPESSIVNALNALCSAPDKWDGYVKIGNLLGGTLLPIFAGAIGLGLLTNLLAGYSHLPTNVSNQEFHTYVTEHLPAVAVTTFSLVVALIAFITGAVLRMSIP